MLNIPSSLLRNNPLISAPVFFLAILKRVAFTFLNGRSVWAWALALLAGVWPPFLWTLSFKQAKHIPLDWRPPIHTDFLYYLNQNLISPLGLSIFTLLLIPFSQLLIYFHSSAWSRYPDKSSYYASAAVNRLDNRNQGVEPYKMWSPADTLETIEAGNSTLDREQDWKERQRTGFIYSCAILCFPTALGICHWLAHRGITDARDLCAFATYGALHFASPFIAGFWLWGFAPQGIAKMFGYCLGAQNLCGLFTHLVFPTAAPWFFDVYGPPGIHPVANYEDFPGNPAGLIRVDDILGTSIYRNAFKKSPVVFGAIPSLHAATAVCFALFVGRYCRWTGRIVMTIYTLWMFWSTMYLHHHFAVDLVLGTAYSVTAFLVAYVKVLRQVDERHYDQALTTAWERLWYGRRDGDRLIPLSASMSSSSSMNTSMESDEKREFPPPPKISIQEGSGSEWNNVEV